MDVVCFSGYEGVCVCISKCWRYTKNELYRENLGMKPPVPRTPSPSVDCSLLAARLHVKPDNILPNNGAPFPQHRNVPLAKLYPQLAGDAAQDQGAGA